MTTKATRVKHTELVEIARNVVLPEGVTDLVMAVEHTPGSKIAGTDLWSGLGGHTQYGPAWLVNGRETTKPIALFDSQKDARELFAMIAGEEGELWQRREARRIRLAERDAAEAAAAAEEKELLKEAARAAKKPVHSLSQSERKRILGGGSSQPSSSSERPTVSTQMRKRVEESERSLTA